ncbi:MAG: TOBE domain-containing protein [Prolixibacteraceae bacterium]|nr:TOBE domain-containing protein [Prolixibacteraceae bacterium]
MNKLPGTIANIQQSGAILLVDADVNGHGFSALLIESASLSEWLQIGNTVDLVFKETEVSLAKNLSGQISLRNRMKCVVQEIVRGDLLCKIKMSFQDYIIYSAITTRSVDAFHLAVGDEVEALVKANEVSLMKKR